MEKVFAQRLTALSDKDNARFSRKKEAKLSPETMMLAKNLVAPHYTETQHRQTRDGTPIPDEADLSKMFKSASTSVRDSRNILKSSPELCMGIDIYISGLLSPNDVSAPDLNITSSLTGELQPFKSAMIDVIREWAKDEYKIDARLKEWVFKAKYLQGAVPLVVIPLTAIDEIINEENKDKRKLSLESYDSDVGVFRNGYHNCTGLLGAGINAKTGAKKQNSRSVFSTLNMESADQRSDYDNTISISNDQKDSIKKQLASLAGDKGGTAASEMSKRTIDAISQIFIHDNVEALKIPSIAAVAARKSIKKRYSPLYAMEDASADADLAQVNGRTIELEQGKLVYPDRSYSFREIVNIRPTDMYDNVGHPIVEEYPYSCCFPISPPGLPDKHLGYIIALDSTCSPLSMDDEGSMDPSDISMQTSSGVMGTQMLSQVADASIDGMSNQRYGALNNASNRLFNSFLVADLKERLKNGLYNGVELDVRFTEVFLAQMWRRAMIGQQVQFLFIPTELLTYIAFEFNPLGMGESKLAKHRDIAIIASTVQLANALTAVNNSIQHKKATITFDDDEIDAFDTDEKLKQYIARSQWSNALFSSSNSQDQLNHILNSGWHFAYENGNGAFPGTQFDIEYLTREANQIDNEYLDSVNKRLIMLSGVSPEIVDMSQEVEFAQTYITGHMLRAQQAALEQVVLCKSIDRFIQSFSLNSKIIINKLLEIVKSARIANNSPLKNSTKTNQEFIEEFIESITTSLPKPDTTKLDAQKENLATHEEYIDKVIEIYFDDPLFAASEMGEKLGDKLDLFKAIWKSSYMRNVLQTNNLVPKQFQALHGSVDRDDFIDPFVESEAILENFSKLALSHEGTISKLRIRNDKIVEVIVDKETAAGGDTDNTETSPTPEPAASTEEAPEAGDDKKPDDADGNDLFEDGGSDNPLG